MELAKGKYRGFNDHHLSEKLTEEEGIEVCREKVRQILRAQGIASPRKRRPPRHRSRRARRVCEGMMLQVDGSPHDWLEGRGPYLTLEGGLSMTPQQGERGLLCRGREQLGLSEAFLGSL